MTLYTNLCIHKNDKKKFKTRKLSTPNTILGIANPLDPNNTNNQAILILKYYLYK